VQRGAAHQLDLEVPLAEHPPRGLTDHGERLGQQVVQRFVVGVALAELVGLGPQLGVGQLLDVVFEGVDMSSDVAQPLNHLALAYAEQAVQNHPVDLISYL
jgi:hypothetical protein